MRTYTWTAETPDDDDVRVTAQITGYDEPDVNAGPVVEIMVERSFCPSFPDKCKGCEWEDVTDSQSEDWLDTQRQRALALDRSS